MYESGPLVPGYEFRAGKVTQKISGIVGTYNTDGYRLVKHSVSIYLFSFSHQLSMIRLRPSSSLSTGCVVSLRGD